MDGFLSLGNAEVVEDAGMIDLQVYTTQKNCRPGAQISKALNLIKFRRKHYLQESGGQVVLTGGTVVTLVNKANKCIRKVSAQ